MPIVSKENSANSESVLSDSWMKSQSSVLITLILIKFDPSRTSILSVVSSSVTNNWIYIISINFTIIILLPLVSLLFFLNK